MGCNLLSRAPRRRPARYATASALLLAWGAAACAGPSGPAPLPPAAPASGFAGAGLELRLVFGAEADLDLFVTDPAQETVYFGNNPSRSGGRLARDLRCDAPAPRTERVHFADPLPGRYRVSLHHAQRCSEVRGPVPWRVEARAGELGWQASGTIEPGRFLGVALELELPGPDSPSPGARGSVRASERLRDPGLP